MAMEQTESEILKNILDNIHHPEVLDGHPWVSRLFVQDALERNGQLRKERPGRQLIAALCELFPKTMPNTPPRRGKRLDTHWGEFGILASLYFAPLQLGLPAPNSLRDAWGRIDQTILFYVYGCDGKGLPENEIEAYRLVGCEPEVAPTSTLSDWHRKGIQKLADFIPTYERYLEKPFEGNPGSLLARVVPEPPAHRQAWAIPAKAILLVLAVAVFTVLALGGYKAQRIYRAAVPLRDDLSQLRGLAASDIDPRAILGAGPLLSRARQDFDLLSDEGRSVLWLGDWLGWLPVHGGDLASSRQMLDMADLLLQSTETTYAAFQPLLTLLKDDPSPDPSLMIGLLGQAQPELMMAREALARAEQARSALDLDRLSPQARSIIEGDLDRLMPLMDEGLAVATSLPHLLGAASDGPKTYLLLAQNEDELRPTGGFITAVGTLVVQDGEVVAVTFVDSGELENWERPYPSAPWQLERYMNSPVLVLRDANWFPDFPTSALYIESLYAYRYSHSVDGVIAFDQQMLVSILEAVGPIQVEGTPGPIDAGNVIAFMRSSKSLPAGQPVPEGWSRKGFMDKITGALLAKISQGEDISWKKLGEVVFQGLNEHHLFLQLDEPALSQAAASRGWDGALKYPGGGDFLMVVDANIGFNKTNAVVERSLSYDVDLTQLSAPLSTLTVTHQNNASAAFPCIQWGAPRAEGEEEYPIDACYWNYMRVYVPAGTGLLEATPQRVPDDWMALNHGVNGEVDTLDEEIDGLQAYGALMVVPGGGSLTKSFQFRIPERVLNIGPAGDQIAYALKIKKQPGTLAVPITLRIHFPNGATLESAPAGAVLQGNHLLIETDLRTDLDLQVRFRLN
jgi:hypothetical protein